jgi:hypothetical protein
VIRPSLTVVLLPKQTNEDQKAQLVILKELVQLEQALDPLAQEEAKHDKDAEDARKALEEIKVQQGKTKANIKFARNGPFGDIANKDLKAVVKHLMKNLNHIEEIIEEQQLFVSGDSVYICCIFHFSSLIQSQLTNGRPQTRSSRPHFWRTVAAPCGIPTSAPSSCWPSSR